MVRLSTVGTELRRADWEKALRTSPNCAQAPAAAEPSTKFRRRESMAIGILLEADAENLPRLKFTSARERDYDVRLGISRRAPCSARSRFSPRRWLPRIRLPTRRSRPARCWAR